MPVGFENSALKMSFSLSSLQSGAGQGSPQQARIQAERPYNSLTKKTRGTLEREMWRRSWGTQEEKKDEFWAALQTNYNYLMDNNLIESCKEASGELSCDEDDALLSKWSFKHFTAQFSELCSWLDDIREAIYGKEENIRDRDLRLEHVGAMQRNADKRKIFTEQANRLLVEHPELQDEVTWRLNHLNSKWEMLEQFISPSKVDSSQINFCADVEHEADCLKEWIREMERRLKPLNMQIGNNWNNQELLEKITEYEVLHQDIKAHGKVVAAVLKRAELAEATASVELATCLERRWHLLFLRALEWQYHLENLLKNLKYPYSEHMCSESDEEPLTKHPRLSSGDCSDQTDEGSYFEDDIKDFWVQDKRSTGSSGQMKSSRKDSCSTIVQGQDVGVSVDNTELHQNQTYSCTNVTKEISREIHSVRRCEVTAMQFESHKESSAHSSSSRMDDSNEINKSGELASFQQNNSDSKELDVRRRASVGLENVHSKVSEVKLVEDSSDEEWTYMSGRRTLISKQKEFSQTLKSSAALNQKRNVAIRLDFGEGTEEGMRSEKESSLVNTTEVSAGSDQTPNSFSYETLSFPSSTENTKECIQWLVRQAELLVRDDSLACGGDPLSSVNEAKHARIKQWVKMHSPIADKYRLPDSCDASGEYTTGDSDGERSSEYLEDSSDTILVNKHLDTFMDSSSSSVSPETPKDPKVILRRDNTKKYDGKDVSKGATSKQWCKRERPWSVSGISQLSAVNEKDDRSYLANFSTSESALHQMNNESTGVIQDREYNEASPHFLQDNLSSSTVQENSGCSSLPRRKGRHRKKHSQNISAKVESPSDFTNQPAPIIYTSRCVLKTPILKNYDVNESLSTTDTKIRTVSETTCTSITTEFNTISDCSTFPTESGSSKVEDAAMESEKDLPSESTLPVFLLGPKEGAITPKTNLTSNQLLQSGGDSDGDRMGILQTDEQLSSSEQAWDSYQEKYLSEPYSEEIADSEEARRLLEFGDDYHNFLDSLSDCASSVEVCQKISPIRKRKSVVATGDSSVLDSDSDLEDIHHLIKQSKSHLSFTEQVLNKHISKISSEIWLSDYEEIVATCKENKRCLKVILENVKEGDILTVKERKEIEEVLCGWDMLQLHADELQRVSSLQQKLNCVRKMLLETTTRISSLIDNLNDLTNLDSIIQILKEEMESLSDFKDQLQNLNDAVHELVTEPVDHDQNISSVMPQLKDDVTDLYRIWSHSYESVSTRIMQLEKAVETWHKFDREITDLQTTLQGDQSTLLSLRQSLDDGASSVEDVAVSIQDIARVLSEVPRNFYRDNLSSQDCQDASCSPRECSLSDSGISDAGSDHELSVRARRLASLRQLARDLQSELGTSEGIVSQINERIDYLDLELRNLQEVCRKLIVRTSLYMETPQSEAATSLEPKVLENEQPATVALESCDTEISRSAETSPWADVTFLIKDEQNRQSNKTDKKQRRSLWVWRILRASVPFHLTLLTLLCLVYVMEPHCCESVNNMNFSLSPKLRYMYGPPPV